MNAVVERPRPSELFRQFAGTMLSGALELMADQRSGVPQSDPTARVIRDLETAVSQRDRRIDELKRQLAQDRFLKSLLNKDAGAEALKQQYLQLHAHNQNGEDPRAWVVVAFDLDHFKKFNDTYGHAIGDEVLHIVEKTLHRVYKRDTDLLVKHSDALIRNGGEEFIVALEMNVSANPTLMAMKMAREFQAALGAAELRDQQGEIISARKITASMGIIVTCPGLDERDLTQTLSDADAASYYVKENGRNGIHMIVDNHAYHLSRGRLPAVKPRLRLVA